MAVFLDSANLDHAREARSLGFVVGATTNPKLLAQAGLSNPQEAMALLSALFPGPVFYQLRAREKDAMRAEAKTFAAIAPNLGLKIMCHIEGLSFAAEASREFKVAVTGVFTSAQAYLAAQAGAHYIIPYVNRITRYMGSGPGAIADMAKIVSGTPCEILAAGIKTASEAVETLLAGAHHISLPLEVIKEMARSPWTEQAMDDFDAASRH